MPRCKLTLRSHAHCKLNTRYTCDMSVCGCVFEGRCHVCPHHLGSGYITLFVIGVLVIQVDETTVEKVIQQYVDMDRFESAADVTGSSATSAAAAVGLDVRPAADGGNEDYVDDVSGDESAHSELTAGDVLASDVIDSVEYARVASKDADDAFLHIESREAGNDIEDISLDYDSDADDRVE